MGEKGRYLIWESFFEHLGVSICYYDIVAISREGDIFEELMIASIQFNRSITRLIINHKIMNPYRSDLTALRSIGSCLDPISSRRIETSHEFGFASSLSSYSTIVVLKISESNTLLLYLEYKRKGIRAQHCGMYF